MEKLIKFLVKRLSHSIGYKLVMMKMGNGKVSIEGDREMYPYFDFTGYTFKKEPLYRNEIKKHLKTIHYEKIH